MSSMYFPTGQRDVPIRLVLICMIMYAITAEGLQFVSLTHKLPPGDIVMDTTSYSSPGLFYGTCTKNPFDTNNYDCTFAMETNSKMGSLEHLRFCNFTIHTGRELYHFSVFAIDKDKAILKRYNFTTDSEFISILHFSDCREVPVNMREMRLLSVNPANNGVFDVGSQSEDGHKNFHTLINFEGLILTEEQKDSLNFQWMAIQSPLKWRLTVHKRFGTYDDHDEHIVQIDAINYDGSTELIKKYPMDEIQWMEKEYGISTTHELLSVCTVKDSRIYGGQFNLNGGLKFELNSTLSQSSRAYFVNCYNLPGGGLVLLLSKCSISDPYYAKCINHTDDYQIVKKFDNAGRLVGSLQLRQFPKYRYSPVSRFHFFVNEKKEMCLSALDTKEDSSDNQVTLNVACFDGEDLSL